VDYVSLDVLFLSNMKRNPLRNIVVTLAIALSISMVMVLSSLSVGVRDSSRESLLGIGADLYVVPEDLHPLLMDLQRFDQGWSVQRELQLSEYPPSHVSPRLSDTLFFRIGEDLGETITVGVDPGEETAFDQFMVVEGGWFSTLDDPLRDQNIRNGVVDGELMTKEVLVSREFSREHGLGVGDGILLSSSLINGTEYSFRIEGIFVDSLARLSPAIIVHLGELQFMKGNLEKDTLTEILLDYPSGYDLDKVKEWSRSGDFKYRDIVDILSSEDILEEIYEFIGIIDGFAVMVVSVTLFICLIFTSTIFLISAKERALDLAILRAIGIPARKIFIWVIMESGIFYLLGCLGGLLLGSVSIYLLNLFLIDRFTSLPEGFQPFGINMVVISTAVLSSFLLALLSALAPAVRAVLKPPVESLRGDVS